jgi:hypothetical protein
MTIDGMTDEQLLFYSLNMWANHIETGDVNMGAQDAVRCGKKGLVRALSTDQMRLIVRLRDLGNKQAHTMSH